MRQPTNITALLNFLCQQKLTAEEALLLYTIYIQKEQPNDTVFLKSMKEYYDQFKYTEEQLNGITTPWSVTATSLVDRGYLNVLGPIASKKGDLTKIDIRKLEVTDKFTSSFIASDRDTWYDYWLNEVYGTTMNIKGTLVSTTLPDSGETPESIKKRFWDMCGGGIIFMFQELCENTREYGQYFFNNGKPNMKVTTFLKNYKEQMDALKQTKLENSNLYTNKSNDNY